MGLLKVGHFHVDGLNDLTEEELHGFLLVEYHLFHFLFVPGIVICCEEYSTLLS